MDSNIEDEINHQIAVFFAYSEGLGNMQFIAGKLHNGSITIIQDTFDMVHIDEHLCVVTRGNIPAPYFRGVCPYEASQVYCYLRDDVIVSPVARLSTLLQTYLGNGRIARGKIRDGIDLVAYQQPEVGLRHCIITGTARCQRWVDSEIAYQDYQHYRCHSGKCRCPTRLHVK